MDKKDTKINIKRLSNNLGFYNNVFKKSEKIASVVLYLLSFKDTDSAESLLEKRLEEKSFKLHEVSLKSLNQVQGSTETLLEVRQCLLELMSTLELASASRVIPGDLVQTLVEHIDVVHRHLNNHYLNDEGISTTSLHSVTHETIASESADSAVKSAAPAAAPKVRRQQRVSVPAGDISTDAYLVYSQLTDRAERIKTVLEAKPEATIKDVAEIVTDVSEKTIQRELNSLIEKGQVKRTGERRWSRYSAVKD